MALAAFVTKQSVMKMQHPDGNRFMVELLLELKDGTTVMFSRTFQEQYVQGEGAAVTQARFRIQMQAAIDAYKAEQQIFTSAAMNTNVTAIQAALVV